MKIAIRMPKKNLFYKFALPHFCARLFTVVMESKVSSLHIYPVKSCAAIDVEEINILSSGPEFDRQWMFVDENGKFVSQRERAQMALIKPNLLKDKLVLKINGETFETSLFEETKLTRPVSVWRSQIIAHEDSHEVSAAASEYLKMKVSFVRYGTDSMRTVNSTNHPLTFADAGPLLLINENSVKDLALKAATESSLKDFAARFRANIIVSGMPEYDEDHLKKFQIGSINFKNHKPCMRCKIITINQSTAQSSAPQPLSALSKYRMVGGKVAFGVYIMPKAIGAIRTGDVLA